jgi:hypothetical protein
MGITKGDKIMNVTIFTELTTTEKLAEITKESEKYIGLYVEMADPKQRKYVKDQAESIKSIRKNLNTLRIKKVKDYTAKVKKEFDGIDVILSDANGPFTLLIDGYADERKVILDAEKKRLCDIERAAQKEVDHEWAIILDKSYLADKIEAERIQLEHDENIRLMAVERAGEVIRSKIAYEKDLADRQEKGRLADVEHVRHINRLILKEMHGHGLPEKESIEFIKTMARKQISQLTINY